MMKETYKVKCPKRIVFGDPLYFESFEGERLNQLVVDITPPSFFAARVVLEEVPVKGLPGDLGRLMTVYLARERTIEVYMRGMQYEEQEVRNRKLPVDSASYCLRVDDRDDVIHTGGDGYWGSFAEYYWKAGDRDILDCSEVRIVIPDEIGMEEMRRYLHNLFEDVEQVKNVEMFDGQKQDFGPVIH